MRRIDGLSMVRYKKKATFHAKKKSHMKRPDDKFREIEMLFMALNGIKIYVPMGLFESNFSPPQGGTHGEDFARKLAISRRFSGNGD